MSAVSSLNAHLPIAEHLLHSQPNNRGWISHTVQWFKQPGSFEGLRKVLAVTAALFLSLTIIGIPIVILAYREWTRIEGENQISAQVMGPHLQRILERLPNQIESADFRNSLNEAENFLNARERFLRELTNRFPQNGPGSTLNLTTCGEQEAAQYLNVLRAGFLTRRTLVQTPELCCIPIQTDFDELNHFSYAPGTVQSLQHQFAGKKAQLDRLKALAGTQTGIETGFISQFEARQRELIGAGFDARIHAVNAEHQQRMQGIINDLENITRRSQAYQRNLQRIAQKQQRVNAVNQELLAAVADATPEVMEQKMREANEKIARIWQEP